MATPVQSDVYYSGVYWNSYESVVRHLNQRAYDSPDGDWVGYVRRRVGAPSSRALSLNCGAGWLERDLITEGLANEVVGVDFLDDLLERARAASVGLPVEYVQMDTNTADFPPGPFDLVVNHAAGHHIAKVDRVFRAARELLPPDGLLLMWDYTGPHRNQYGRRIWAAAHEVNDRLPEQFRSTMSYPHLPTMLVTDPTEAIHSELLLDVVERYFTFEHRRALGGAIAYLVLTHNDALFGAPTDVREELIAIILEADVAHLERYPEDNLFTFAMCRPRPSLDVGDATLEQWSRAEEEREQEAIANEGRYYAPTSVELEEYPPEPLVIVVEPELGPYDIARRGIGFTASAFVRAVAMRVPGAVTVLGRVRRLVTRRGRSSTPG